MRTWDLIIPIDETSAEPLFRQIAAAIAEGVRAGRLRPGAALPGSRALAGMLKVHRNTILAAYQELESAGWVLSRPGSGTFVAGVADAAPRGEPRAPGYALHPAPDPCYLPPVLPPGTLWLSGGSPDVRLLPVAALARAYRHALRQHGGGALSYGDPRGHERLRGALAPMLGALRGLPATPSTLLLTRGSQHGLDLLARALLRPGDVVAVEGIGYRPAWTAFRLSGAVLRPLPLDREGVDPAALEALCAEGPVRVVYLTPHHQFPTTVSLGPARRRRVLELARARGIAVIEDDYDFEFHYDGRPLLPMASDDPGGVVAYVGTLSKVLAPGLRIGFVHGPEALIETLASLRTFADRQGDQAVECAVAALVEEGELARHVRRVRAAYERRRDALAAALRRRCGGALRFEVPAGGMALWAELDGDVEALRSRALTRGVGFMSARSFTFDGAPAPAARLGFISLDEDELREAARRLGAALAGRDR